MNLVRKIIGFCMNCKRERQEKRVMHRRELHATQLKTLQQELRFPEKVKPIWEELPQRLRRKAQAMINKKLWEIADDDGYKLPAIIKSARICNAVDRDEERRLFQTAYNKSHTVGGKFHFAKAIHRKEIPPEIVLNITQEINECGAESARTGALHNVPLFIDQINQEDEDEINALLTAFAEKGHYYYLKCACDSLRQQIPSDLLRMCFNAHRHNLNCCETVTDMCLALQDWETGRELIDCWKNDHYKRQHASRLALALFEAQNQPVEADA